MDSKYALLAVASPRDLEKPKASFDEIDYVDKLWVKYASEADAYNTIRNFFLGRNYEILVISTDDLILPYFSVAQLIHDLERHPEIKVLSGVCNLGSPAAFDLRKKMKIVAINLLHARNGFSEAFNKNYPIHRINVTFKPLVSSESEKVWTLSQYRFPCSHVIFDEQRIQKVWFQGFAPGAIRREVVEQMLFRGYQRTKSRVDVSFALDCQKAGIDVYADFNVVTPHHQHYDKMLVGKASPHTQFEPLRRQMSL